MDCLLRLSVHILDVVACLHDLIHFIRGALEQLSHGGEIFLFFLCSDVEMRNGAGDLLAWVGRGVV